MNKVPLYSRQWRRGMCKGDGRQDVVPPQGNFGSRGNGFRNVLRNKICELADPKQAVSGCWWYYGEAAVTARKRARAQRS